MLTIFISVLSYELLNLKLDKGRLINVLASDLGELLHSNESIVFFAEPYNSDSAPESKLTD
jgi:hypothetical protein